MVPSAVNGREQQTSQELNQQTSQEIKQQILVANSRE